MAVRPSRRQIIEHLAIASAGMRAEYRQHALDNALADDGQFDRGDRRWQTCSDDLLRFEYWEKYLGKNWYTRLTATARADEIAQKIVVKRWPAIRMLADYLLVFPFLLGDSVDRIARHAQPGEWWPIKAITDTRKIVPGSMRLADLTIRWRRMPKKKSSRLRQRLA